MTGRTSTKSLTRFAWLSIVTAIITMFLKGIAWKMTGSVGLLSDAVESLVNLAGALMALWMLILAARPADKNHTFGHSKAEYFSSAFEGILIILAAFSIGYAATGRLLHPQPLEEVGMGLLISVLASVLNGTTAIILLKAGKQHNSITLEADAHHLLTDVWTSIGVITGVICVWLTGWIWLDPVIAMIVAVNIVWMGYRLLYRSADGLLDASLSNDILQQIDVLLSGYAEHQIQYHTLKTRVAGGQTFIQFHVQVPDTWTVKRAHSWTEFIEINIRNIVPHASVLIHIEPLVSHGRY